MDQTLEVTLWFKPPTPQIEMTINFVLLAFASRMVVSRMLDHQSVLY